MLLTILAACTLTEPADEPPVQPDVLLVVLDTVRADALTSYGNPRPTAPQFEALAASGALFEDVTAPAPWTWASHGSLFTGLYPWEHGAHFTWPDAGSYTVGATHDISALRDDVTTLAERFNAAGYRTASVSANYMLQEKWGMTRGFQRVELRAGDDAGAVAVAGEILQDPDPRPLFLFVNLFEAHDPYEPWTTPWIEPRRAELDPETGQQWIRPYFLEGVGLVLNKKHDIERSLVMDYATGELEIPPEGLTMIRDLYDAGVSREDRALRALIGIWNDSGRSREIVAVTSDHGEYLGEHQQLAHSRTVYPAVTRVPMVLAAPGRVPAGTRVDTPVQMHQLHDTLLAMTGIEPDAPRSLLPVVEGQPQDAPILAAAWPHSLWVRELGGAFARGYRLYREGDEALVTGHEMNRNQFGEAVEIRYFRLQDDPGMERDLAAAHPDRVAALRERAAGSFTQTAETAAIAADDETTERLRALGYLGAEDDPPPEKPPEEKPEAPEGEEAP